ncbi:EamA family transporter [Crocinitomicaceae bacterium]|jgi:drug/metabolite transporter (DMT)-like permease|nr:EamA family transporter [Crocinitomicaceae bacterium]
MIALAGTIISSTLIFVIFRLFEKYKVDTFQAIVFNYFTAFICGFLLYSNEFSSKIWIQLDWIPYTFLVSLLFISLFFLMGQSSQKNGVAITSVAVKMSLAVSMVGMILIYNEALTLLKITGILLALAGVLLVSISKNTSSNSNSSWKMLLVLFIGSGILDLTLNYTQQHVLNELTPALFSSFGFGIAGIIGSFVIIYQMVFKSVQIKLKNIIAGIILGIPNYFSIFLLLKTYEFIDLTNSSILAIVNVSVVVFSAIFGFVIFRELFTTQKAIGLIASILAILSLYFAS